MGSTQRFFPIDTRCDLGQEEISLVVGVDLDLAGRRGLAHRDARSQSRGLSKGGQGGIEYREIRFSRWIFHDACRHLP